MAYTRMIRVYYRKEVPLPTDPKAIYRLVRATSRTQREAVDTVLSEFFTLESDGHHQKRCDGELDNANGLATKSRINGKKGGRPRKVQTETEPGNNPAGYEEENLLGFKNNLSQTPDSRLQTPDLKTRVEIIDSGKPASGIEDFIPKDAAEWLRHFKAKHGFEADPHSVNDRKKLWPVFAGWINAGLSTRFVDVAVESAIAGAKDVIVCLPLYVDRVMAGQQPGASPSGLSAGQDRERAYKILTGKQ